MQSTAVAAAGLALLLAAGPGAAQTMRTPAGEVTLTAVASELAYPWGFAFLPDGRILLTERPGRMRIIMPGGPLSPPLKGVPPVRASGQGGLHDIALDRDFARNRTIYFCFAEPADGGGRTSMARARLGEGDAALQDVAVIFRQEGPLAGGLHYGCRIAQAGDGNLFLTLGDHFSHRDEAQNLANHLGKVVRVRPDGTPPADNPFVDRKGTKPEIWSYGHRNSQGAAIHPQSGKLWMHEHGPRGGDEVNIPLAGRNYGWPVIGFGVDYSGARIHSGTQREGMEQPVKSWVPSIAPSGMAFYTGDMFAAWKGSLFVGALAGQMLVRLALDGERVTGEERLLAGLGERIRDVRQGPDGALYIATDGSSGRILRLAPAK